MTTAGVHVHRAERADVLADALAEVLAKPLADPFAAEVVAVPAKGVERWLAQRLSHRLGAPDGDGICAGVAFRSPAALVAESISGAVGGAPDADPWHPERAVWPLLEVLDAAGGEPWCAVLHTHHARRHALARRIAELFGAYATHRPELLRAWRAGGCGVDADLAWQPELWRRLRARIGGAGPPRRAVPAAPAPPPDPTAPPPPHRRRPFGPPRRPPRGGAWGPARPGARTPAPPPSRGGCRSPPPPAWPPRSSPSSPLWASPGPSTCGSPPRPPRWGPRCRRSGCPHAPPTRPPMR